MLLVSIFVQRSSVVLSDVIFIEKGLSFKNYGTIKVDGSENEVR